MLDQFTALSALEGDKLKARILVFANRYGFLGDGGSEPLYVWTTEIARVSALRRAIDCIRSLTAGKNELDRRWLQSHFLIGGPTLSVDPIGRSNYPLLDELASHDASLRFVPVGVEGLDHASVAVRGPLSWKTDEGKTLQLARLAIANEIQHRLRAGYDLVVDPDSGLEFWPTTTLSAIYGLLARQLTGKRLPPRECRGCPEWFVPNRADQQFHSSQCKWRYRYRNKGESS